MDNLTDEQKRIKEVLEKHNELARKNMAKNNKADVNLGPELEKILNASYYKHLMDDFEKGKPKRSIRPPKANNHLAFKIGVGAVAVMSLATYAVLEFKPDKPPVITPKSYSSFCENTDEYTRGVETAQKFETFEDSLKTYQELSQNPEGLSYIDKQKLEKTKEYIKSNYQSFVDIYLYQTKSKVAIAYGLSEEKLDDLEAKTNDLYSSIDDNSPDDLIPRISNDGNAYLSKITGDTSSVVMPKELKNALSDIGDLQEIWSEDKNFPYDEVLEKYNNFLKFLSLKFEADEKGNISLSDETYEYSDEDLIEYYSPIYESLMEKKEANGGKLKKSQEKRLQEVMNEMYSSLLQTVKDKIDFMSDIDPENATYYKNAFMEILGQVTDSKLSPTEAFSSIYNINSNLDEQLGQNSSEGHNHTQELDGEER